MNSRLKLVGMYSFFAVIATCANIGVQDLVVLMYRGVGDVLISMVFGTGAGLVIKYILDKRYIFRFCARNVVHDGQIFALYVVMGLVTTGVFWGFEIGFQYLFETKGMRYLGAVIGLTIGYFAKYYLDKRFVFCVEDA